MGIAVIAVIHIRQHSCVMLHRCEDGVEIVVRNCAGLTIRGDDVGSAEVRLTADLPGGILTDLKNSSMKGIVLLSGDTALVSGKPYSANYSGYAVSATLIVTYS